MRAHLQLVLTLTACLALSGCMRKVKDDTKGVLDWLVVPVFYATNRVEDVAAEEIDYKDEPNHKGLLFGIKNIVVPMPKGMAIDDATLKQLGWRSIHLDVPLKKGIPPVPADCPVASHKIPRDKIVGEADDYTTRSGANELVLFLHGCCATFDTTMHRAAKVAARMQVPLIVYDWVSPRGFTRYLENETLAEQTLDPFHDFLVALEALVPPESTTLIGHSMGAKFVDAVMVRRAERLHCDKSPTRYREVIMSNADIDARSYINHAKKFVSNATRTRLYISTDDDRLDASAFAHGGFARLGAPGRLLGELRKIEGQDIVDITGLDTGHELPFDAINAVHHAASPAQVKGFNCTVDQPNLYYLKPERLAVTK